jgi:hypothetical protein
MQAEHEERAEDMHLQGVEGACAQRRRERFFEEQEGRGRGGVCYCETHALAQKTKDERELKEGGSNE